VIVFDDYAEILHKNQDNSSVLAIFSRFFEFWANLTPIFPGKSRGARRHLDRDAPCARIKAKQKPAGRGDHRHVESSPRVGLGAPSCLAEVIERTMHVKGSIADAEQYRWTLGTGNYRHDSSTPNMTQQPEPPLNCSPALATRQAFHRLTNAKPIHFHGMTGLVKIRTRKLSICAAERCFVWRKNNTTEINQSGQVLEPDAFKPET
jgi:hypothetical protein